MSEINLNRGTLLYNLSYNIPTISGAVIIANIVDSITAFEAKIASLSNSSANMVVVAATGIASAVTITDVIISGTLSRYKMP